MSPDQQETSFGDSNAQPPTPKQTPTSTSSFFSSPVFETPKAGLNSATATATPTPGTDWTPRFAEDFSVFNNTPGNLRGAQSHFDDFVAPFTSPALHESVRLHAVTASPSAPNHHKRPLSVGTIAAEIATHVNHFPANASLPLPPVEPSRRLPSSPGSLVQAAFSASADNDKDDKDNATRTFSPDYDGARPNPGSPRAKTRVPKKARTDGPAAGGNDAKDVSAQAQTATPPPSARKGGRRIAPNPQPAAAAADAAAMQSDQGFGPQHQPPPPPPDFLNTPQQQHMASFVNSPADLFSYPMSAPASATGFADARAFWGGGDPGMSAMDVDYAAAAAAAGAHAFHMQAADHRHLDAIDWAQANQANQVGHPGHADQSYMLASGGDLSQHVQQPHFEGHHMQQVPMTTSGDPKQHMMPAALDTASIDHQTMYAGGYPAPVDDPFGIVSPNGGVNPGLLFSRPPSSSMDAMASDPSGVPTTMAMADASAAFGPRSQLPHSSAPAVLHLTQSSPPQPLLAYAPSSAQQKELRRSASAREIAPRRKAGDRPSASSPVKATARPGLSRSFSENRGSRLRGRASLPTLAPAVKQPSPLPSGHHGAAAGAGAGMGLGITRSTSFGGAGRPTGRSSPIRMHHQRQQQQQQQQQHQQQQQDQQHQRLSSLTSIPEVNTPQARASVKFTIDANGRARVETTVDEDGESAPPSTLRRNQSARSLHGKSKWDSSTDDDSSSTDDEPIIIPSRTTSFALPDPVKPTIGRGPVHSSQRSVSDRSTTSTLAAGTGDLSYNDPESEAETVMNDVPKGAGDAASELEKLRHMRQKRASGLSGAHGGMPGGMPGANSNLFGSVPRGLQLGGPFGGTVSMHGGGGGGGRPQSMQAVSPTTLTDASLPTPSTGSRSHGIRCICGRADAPPSSDGFIVQCESCDLWLHGRCINITKRTLPSVYICAFCAQTPNVRGMRIPPPGVASSPLAHKSFKQFR